MKAFALVEAYATTLAKMKNINAKHDSSNTEKMFAHLLDKLADSKFKPKTEAAYFKFF
jgi:hypothetical protein